MRVETAVSLPGAPIRALLRRRSNAFVAMLIATVLLACNEPLEVTAPPIGPSVGWLTGSVTLLGNDGPSHPNGNITLYASPQDLEQRVARYGAILNRRDGVVRVYDFAIGGIAPGEYYVLACWTIGCGEYRDPVTGALRTVRVSAGRVTRFSFGL
jgi:hypothetical protein